MDRDQIRQQLIEKRQALSPELIQHFSRQITTHFLASDIYRHADHIACYLTTMNEVDCHHIIEQIFLDNKHCYLPVVDPTTEGQMYFFEYLEDDELVKNKFGILEPANKTRMIDIKSLDLILAPLVAYDTRGHRLGMGVGYYDRALGEVKKGNNKKPIFCGLGYQIQAIDNIPKEDWDVPLDFVVNEIAVIGF